MRESEYLRQRYRTVTSLVGLIGGLTGILMLTPLVSSFVWPLSLREAAAFLVPGLSLALCGALLWRLLGRGTVAPTRLEGAVVILLSWVLAGLVGAIPFMLLEDLDLAQAVFESVSGWTTTGLSVVDVTNASPIILLWRSILQLAGGAGLAIIMLAAVAGPGGISLSAAEGRTDQLVPNVRASAVLVMRLYVGYAAIGVLGLMAAGMNWFDAVNHAFAAISTGGFSTRPDSIGHWDSPRIEAVTIGLMILGNLNFLTAWSLARGHLRSVWRNGEVRVMAVLVPVCAGTVFWLTCRQLYPSLSESWRVAIFETISALTTTGFSTVSYSNWNSFGVLILVTLMLVGAGICSTGGALKQQRVYLLFRAVLEELRRPAEPRTAVARATYWRGEERAAITDELLRSVGTFAGLYLATWLAGASVLAACGYSLGDSLFEFASALGTVGLSVGVTSATTPATVLWAQTAGMLLGRLEFFVVFAGAGKLLRDLYWMTKGGGTAR